MCEKCTTKEVDGLTIRSEAIRISPTTEHQEDSIGFNKVVNTDDDQSIEQACQELEQFLKQM